MKKYYLLICIILVTALNLNSKDFNPNDLPKVLGISNMGKEFYFSFIPCWETPKAKNDLKLYISSSVETLVTVEVVGKGWSKQKKTIPNDIIEFTLTSSTGQPYSKSPWVPSEMDQVWKGAAVHVIADDPIICYGVTRYQYTSDGFLAIPVAALGKEYIVASFPDVASNNGQWLPSYTAISAPYDKTKVFFTMGGYAWSRTVSGQTPGQTTTWNLNKGDVLLFSSLGKDSDLTGSKIISSKPVSVVSGNFCAYVPTNCGCCDVLEEMEIPTNLWGTEYHVTPIANRIKHSLIRIFAKEAKTKIFKDHVEIGFINDAGGVKDDGWLEMRADNVLRPVVISGDKPIGVTQYNTGQQDDGIASDPFQMVLTSLEQYQREIIFNTPGIKGGYGFPYNYLNLVYETTQFDSIPDDLMFAQVMNGNFEWVKIKDIYPTPGDSFVNVQGGKKFCSKTLLLPGDGVYKIKADKPFTAYAYGFSSYDSYGFPTSVALVELPKIDTLPPEPDWIIDCDGTVNDYLTRYVTDKPDDESNRSNLSTIYIDNSRSYNYKLYHQDFMPCETTKVPWGLDIINNQYDARAVVHFIDCAGNDTTVTIEYFAVKLTIDPKLKDYGLQSVGNTINKMLRVVNQSGTSTAYLKFLILQRKDELSKPQGFTLWDSTGTIPLPTVFGEQNEPGIKIEPLDSYPFIVRFDATQYGEYWDSIGFGDTCNFWYKSYVSALVGAPVIDVTDWNFPLTTIDSSTTGTLQIKNTGIVPLEIYDYRGPFTTGIFSGNKIFTSQELDDLNITPTTPLILNPQELRTLQVKFTPDDEINYIDSIVFISNSAKDEEYNNGNSIDSICIIAGDGTTVDVEDESIIKSIYVYPLPASDKIAIISESEIHSVKIFDILGCERDCPFSISVDRTVINTSELNNGIYFLLIKSENKFIIEKFVICK